MVARVFIRLCRRWLAWRKYHADTPGEHLHRVWIRPPAHDKPRKSTIVRANIGLVISDHNGNIVTIKKSITRMACGHNHSRNSRYDRSPEKFSPDHFYSRQSFALHE